jgi:hypothetical protein
MFLLGIAAGISKSYRHLRFSATSTWSGMPGNFLMAEPIRFDARWYTGTRDNFMPQLEIAYAYTHLKVKDDDLEFDKSEWNVAGKIGFEGPFERLSYGYSPSCGGYHTVDLFMVVDYDPEHKVGTNYQFLLGDDYWLLRISLLTDTFTRYLPDSPHQGISTRPIYHRVLGTVAAIPILLISMIICPGCIG